MSTITESSNINHLTCTIKIEERVKAKASVFRQHISSQQSHFDHFARAFQLQTPEFYFRVGNQEIDELDRLRDEVGIMDFSLVAQSQTVLSPERGKQLAYAAKHFTKYWGWDGSSTIVVEIDGLPVKL